MIRLDEPTSRREYTLGLVKQWAMAIALSVAVTFIAFSAAHARGHRHHSYVSAPVVRCDNNGRCTGTATIYIEQQRETRLYDANGNTVIGGRPAGCPHAYCGCGLRKYLGLNDERLNLAWNWARLFPHTAPHPGAAAVRHHHVMLLVAHVEGSIWTVRDYNGGRHLSYIHERDVSGYVFVDPSTRSAMR